MNILEIILLLMVALVVIGPERMPEVLRAAAKILRELRAASNEIMRELTEALEEDPPRRTWPEREDQQSAERREPTPPPGQT